MFEPNLRPNDNKDETSINPLQTKNETSAIARMEREREIERWIDGEKQ